MLFFWNFLLPIGQERIGTIFFIFSLFQPLPTYFGLKWGSNGIVLIFWIFLLFFFMEFSITHRVGKEQNGTIIFVSLFLIFFRPILAWNEFLMVFFNFLNFFDIFLEFSITHRAGKKRNNNFYFLSFSASSNLFWLQMRQ